MGNTPPPPDKITRRVMDVLRSNPCCYGIRFTIGKVKIDRFMYLMLVNAIQWGGVRVRTGADDHYDYDLKPPVLTFASDDPRGPTVVHEATHAIHNQTNAGKKITIGNGEAAAYLAEALFCEYSGDANTINNSVPHLGTELASVARFVKDWNDKNKTGRCHLGDNYLANMIRWMKVAPFESRNFYEELTQIGYGCY
jgi:hypothetical protein